MLDILVVADRQRLVLDRREGVCHGFLAAEVCHLPLGFRRGSGTALRRALCSLWRKELSDHWPDYLFKRKSERVLEESPACIPCA